MGFFVNPACPMKKIFSIIFIIIMTSCSKEVPSELESRESPFSSIYLQCFPRVNTFISWFDPYYDGCDFEGYASYHFINEKEVYINWEKSLPNTAWQYGFQNTSYDPKARIKYFQNTSFDPKTRTFKGSIVFEKRQNSLLNDSRWDYEMIFNEDYTTIIEGQVERNLDDGNKDIKKYNYRNEKKGNRGMDWWYVVDYLVR